MMGSPSPVASKVRKESPSSSSSGKVRPHRRTSSVASSCVSLDLGDQDGQSPGRSNGLGKSPVAVSSSSPRTPAGPEKSGSPAALKKRRASIGSPDDLVRGLDFCSSSPSTEEKKHPFLTRGGGHKKVTAPATQSSSPAKKAATPPGKEKLVTGRATASSGLSPMKSVEAKKDFTSPGRSVLASESSSMNESLVSEGTTGWIAKKASPRASLDSKISAMKSSPRSNTKPFASTRGRTNSNGEEAAVSSPVESLDAETKSSLGKSPDVKIRKSSSVSPLKFKAGLTSPKSNKLAKTRQGSPGIPGRVKTRIEKAEHNEDLHTPELASVAVSMENATVTISGDDSAKKEEEGLTLLPSLMLDGNVGDEDMSSLNQGSGDPGFDNDMEMPTSWLSEDLPCMFSSLSRLPEPDDSSSSLLGDPPEVLDDPFPEDTTHVSPVTKPNHFQTATDIMLTSSVTSESPIKVSKQEDESAWNNGSSSFNLMEDSGEAEDELEPRHTLLFPAVVVVPRSVPLSETGSNIVPPVTESVVHETSFQVNENALTGTQSSQVAFESRGTQPVSSQNVEVPTEVTTKESSESSKLLDLAAYMSVPTAIPALREEGIQTADNDEIPAAEDEIPVAENQYMIASSDDESSDDYNKDSCSAQLNLKQSFDAAAEPAVSRDDEGDCDMLSGEDTCNLASVLSTNTETLPAVTQKTELEPADESQDGEEFTPTEVDHDMMIFDFEEHWALNAGDESSASDASQNGADELQSCSSREVSLLIPAQDEVAKSLPANSSSYEKDTQSAHHEESEEVFHSFESSEQSSSKVETNLSSFSEPTVQHNLEPFAPIPSQSKLASELDSSESLPSYTTLETEHSNAVNIGQVDQNVDVPNDKDEEVEVAEHQNSSVHTLLEQNSSVADLPDSKPDLLWSNTKAQVDEQASAHEALDTPSVSAVNSNGLLSENVQHFDDSTHASYQSVLFPLQDASQKSYFETPAQPEACKTDGSLVMDLKNISPPEVSASTLQSAEITDDRLAAETESQSIPNRDVSSGTGDLINSEVNPSKLLMEESDGNTLNSSAGGEVDSLESSVSETGISEEEQTEAAFLLSLESRGELSSTLNEDSSIPDEKLQTNLSHEESQGQVDIIKVNDPECLAGDEHIPQPKAESLNMSSESEEDELEASEHSDLQMLSKGMFPAEEKPVESQYQEDDNTTQHALQKESAGNMANESEVHHQRQMPLINMPETPFINTPETPLINTPETLLESKEAQASVPTENELPKEVHDESHDLINVSCSPVLDKEDEILNESFDSKFKAESAASLEEADVGTDTVITTAGAAVSDTTSSAEILEKGEAICDADEVSPVSLSAEKFLSLGLNEVGDTDDKLGSEDSVGEERKENASDLEEQNSTAVHGWEEPLLVNYTSDSNSSIEDPMDTLHEELVVTNPTSSAVVDDTTEDLEIHTGKPEEALRTISTPDEKIKCHDHAFQESQLPLATPLSADDQVSETEVALETEEVLMTPAFDDSDDLAVKGVETVPAENITSQEPLVAVHQLTSNAAKSEVEEQENADLTGVKEGEDLSNTPESIPVLKEKDSAVDISQNMDVDESQVSPPPKMYTFDTFSPESTHSVSPGQHSAEETLLEDEETVFYSPVKIFVASDTPDTTILGDVGVETLSPVSWPAGKEAESLNGDFEEESVLGNALVHSPEAKVDFGAQKNLNITDGTLTASLKDENEEESFLQEKPLLQDEKSPEEFIVVSRDDSAISDVDNMEEHSWKGGKEEESLNGSLERDEDIPFSHLKSPADETLKSTISEVICVQNHSDDACNGESFYDALKEESMLEDEDTVVYRPAVEDFPIERTASSKDVETVMDNRVESFNALDDTEPNKPSVEEVLTKGSVPEGVEKVVDSHKEMFDVPDQDTTSKASLIVGEEETLRDEKEGESLNGNIERECKLGVEERTEEPLIAPDVLNTTHKSNSNLVVADELEKQTVKEENIVEQSPEEKSTFEVKEPMVESSEEESVVAPDLQNATNNSNSVVAKELEKQTGKEETTLEQSLEEESTSEAEETMVESPEKESPVAPGLQNATNTSNPGVVKELEKQTGQEETTLEQNPEEESTFEVEEAMVESSENKSVVAPDLQNATNTSNLGVTEELEKQNGQEETTLEQSPEERSSVEVEEKVMVECSEKESLVAPDLQIATNTSNLGVADELEKQTGQEKTTSEQSPEEESTFDVEEAMVESGGKESLAAPGLQNATNTSNLGVAKELEKQSVEEEMALEQIPEERSSIEVEEKMMVESSEKESFFAPDLTNANHTSILEGAEKPEKQTVKEEETLDRNLETKPVIEAAETVKEESSEEESIVAPDLQSAPNTSNLVVADELEKQTDKEDEALDRSLEETVVDNTQQTCVSPDLLNEKTSNMVVELEKQTDTEEETLEEKSMLEVEEKVVESSKESLVASDGVAETLDAEDLDKHPTWKTSNKEGESLNGSTSEEESIQDTVVVSNVKKESVSLSEDATQEPHESGDQTADIVKNSLDETEVTKTDTCAEDLDKSSKISVVAKESCMTNGEKHNAPVQDTAKMQGTTAPTDTQTETTSEPQSPTATLHPLSRPPFSGSQQDRLWEEQAEAYNSGQGTPSHTTKVGASGVSSSSPSEKPTPAEDQIQPVAAAAVNGNHAVTAGPSNGPGSHENGNNNNTLAMVQSKGNGKEKLHTPLRSLLLEDIIHRDPIITPNGVSSSPSFIRRLFRVVSTSSRGSDRVVPQAKLKRSASMWVSCLGSPQVQQ